MKIRKLLVENFKSIKYLEMEPKRINIFIGEPNTGKSNILEVIALLSHIYYGSLNDFVRMESLPDIFYNKDTSKDILININERSLRIYRDGNYFKAVPTTRESINFVFAYDYTGHGGKSPHLFELARHFKFYRFKILRNYRKDMESNFLLPPYGENLVSLLVVNGELREIFRDILGTYGYKLVIKEFENKIEIQHEIDEGILMAFPLYMLSETLYRLLFHLAAISTNENSVIAFEEPEAHTYPFYTKYLAENIAKDKRNQYFITTHNPYMLIPLIEKSRATDITVNITYLENRATKIYSLKEEEIKELLDLDIDALLNLERFLRIMREK